MSVNVDAQLQLMQLAHPADRLLQPVGCVFQGMIRVPDVIKK
jgi:hypothetical protein